MTFQVTTRAWLCDLHCSVGLTDWDMDNELKLATTTDQCYHEDKLNDQYVAQKRSTSASRRKDEFIWYDKTSDTFVKPNPWLWVNPNIVCSVEYEKPASLQTLGGPDLEDQTSGTLHTKHSPKAEFCNFTSHSRTLLPPDLPSTEYMVHNDTSSNACVMKNGASRKPAKARCKRRTPMDNSALKPGCWPRPPVNYCILITLALKTSPSGSLKVQQIYNFIREHFPFFQTAPDGWKNTIRHNLCFNSSFRKTCNQLCRDGKRKSCFWHLTLEGQRRLKDDLSVLTGESLKQLERSMSHPDMIQSIPAM